MRQIDGRHFIVSSFSTENERLKNAMSWKVYPANDLWKLSPALLQRKGKDHEQLKFLFSLRARVPETLKKQLLAHTSEVEVVGEYLPGSLLLVRCSYEALFGLLLPMGQLTFADELNTSAREESVLLDANLNINKLNLVHHEFPHLDGTGVVASVRELRFNPEDIDLRGRYFPGGQESEVISRHATDMATILAGGGNSSPKSKGVARGARLTSADFGQLLPNGEEYFAAHGIFLQNHSYGTAIENYYGSQASAYDMHTYRNELIFHVFRPGMMVKQLIACGFIKKQQVLPI